MNIQWLETFLTAAKFENYHQAAERLFVSQPTVTVHIRQLEKEVGVPLFQRSGRRVMLTSFGRSYVRHAEKVVESHREGLQEMEKKRQGYVRKFTLAVSPQVASSYLPYWVKVYGRENPNTEVVIQVLESEEIGIRVEKGDADLGLSRQEHRSLSLTCKAIQSEKLRFVLPHDGGDAETSLPISVEEALERNVLLTHNHPGYWEEVLLACKRLNPSVREMKVSQVHVTKRFIEEGLGCSVLPDSSVRKELAEGRMIEANAQILQFPKAFTFTIYREESNDANAFLDIVKTLI